MEAEIFCKNITSALDRYLSGQMNDTQLVGIVDDLVAEEFPEKIDAIVEKLINDLHVELALFVVDPIARRESRLYHGPNELREIVASARKSLRQVTSY